MTNDEIIFGANEAFSQLQEYRDLLAQRYRGKTVKAYGDKVFRVTRADIDPHCGIMLRGPVLKMDGTPHARNEYGVSATEAEFV